MIYLFVFYYYYRKVSSGAGADGADVAEGASLSSEARRVSRRALNMSTWPSSMPRSWAAASRSASSASSSGSSRACVASSSITSSDSAPVLLAVVDVAVEGARAAFSSASKSSADPISVADACSDCKSATRSAMAAVVGLLLSMFVACLEN
ncbi:hypothetical protein BC828DRAFT_392817 [Blastocladiella britannica]|nr:hypothetical protein BC828DRAFT_392817 [Blastocladiella britannica]